MVEISPEYLAARRTLLDALAALEPHLDNLILVGAQAVYLHAGAGDVSVAPMTTDADLALDARGLADSPEISAALSAAGFVAGSNPGAWIAPNSVAVDLMVVPHQSGRTRPSARAAHLDPHDRRTARVTTGLEPTLVDCAHRELRALADDPDTRRFTVRVAGPAALMTAKLVKIGERLDQKTRQPDRIKAKDALDLFRLLQSVETVDLVSGFALHLDDDFAAASTRTALEFLRAQSQSTDGVLPQLAQIAAAHDPVVGASFVALSGELFSALDRAEGA